MGTRHSSRLGTVLVSSLSGILAWTGLGALASGDSFDRSPTAAGYASIAEVSSPGPEVALRPCRPRYSTYPCYPQGRSACPAPSPESYRVEGEDFDRLPGESGAPGADGRAPERWPGEGAGTAGASDLGRGDESLQNAIGQNDSLNTVPDSPLALIPDAMGDSYFSGGQIIGFDFLRVICDIPGSRRSKITENNSPLPRDRVYFNYNSFQNVGKVDSNFFFFPGVYDFSCERYTLGVERTFFHGLGSVELRLPFRQPIAIDQGNFAAGNTPTWLDNTTLNFKFLVSRSNRHAIAAGLGVNLPTASDVSGQVNGVDFTLSNETVYLGPFIGSVYCPNERWFLQSFMQFDVAANGDGLTYHQRHAESNNARFNGQTLMYLDGSVGRWLYRSGHRGFLTGLAGVFEMHYTTVLQDTDIATVGDPWNQVIITNLDNRVDILNLTVGVHMEFFRRLNVRVGGVVPVRAEAGDRSFDSEIVAQANLVW